MYRPHRMPRPLTLRDHTWDWSRPYILGILNATPDSFSDAGRTSTLDAALASARRMLAEGADAIDVGGESTRPNAPAVSAADEIARVVPVIEALAHDGALVSIDTTKAAVAEAAFRAGARILNDVGMGDSLADLAAVALRHDAAYLRMHAHGTPRNMTTLTQYDDVVADVIASLRADATALERAGLDPSRIMIDPGIGFAKRAEQSLSLVANIASLRALGYAVCVGPSRKSFIDAAAAYAPHWDVTPSAPHERIGGTAAVIALAVSQGAEILRVHDVAVMRQAARVAQAVSLRRSEVLDA